MVAVDSHSTKPFFPPEWVEVLDSASATVIARSDSRPMTLLNAAGKAEDAGSAMVRIWSPRLRMMRAEPEALGDERFGRYALRVEPVFDAEG
jgi:hypothetical protein